MHVYFMHIGKMVVVMIITINDVYVIVKWSYVKGEGGGAQDIRG